MENLVNPTRLSAFYAGKPIVVTGHTGFKGAWLSFWLAELGARVSGFALPPTDPSLFGDLKLERRLETHQIGDVRDSTSFRDFVKKTRPDIVFHLAAQPLVRHSYVEPRLTFETNVMGVVNLLDAVRLDGGPRVVQVITTDKCYENAGRGVAFRESDPLGGADPYSGSKACAELVVAAYRQSFFRDGISVASARAGNVIGGGDWSPDRIIPDCVRAFERNERATIRSPQATRPWQFVLEPVAGYLALAARQWHEPERFAEAWNFGPFPDAHVSVRALVGMACREWGIDEARGLKLPDGETASSGTVFHEASFLMLDVCKAVVQLGWKPVYDVRRAVAETIGWYRQRWQDGQAFDAEQLCRQQLQSYQQAAAALWLG